MDNYFSQFQDDEPRTRTNLQPQRNFFDQFLPQDLPPAIEPLPAEDPYAVNLGRQAVQGLTFGHADEAEGALRSLITGDPYADERDYVREENRRFSRDNPLAAGTAEFAGGMVLPGGAVKSVAQHAAPGALAKLGKYAGIGAGTGALTGSGYSTSEKFGDWAEDAIEGAAYGAPLGAALGPVADKAAKLLPRLSPQGRADARVAEALQDTPDPEQALRELGPRAMPANLTREARGEAVGVAKQGVEPGYIDQQLGRQREGILEDLAVGGRGADRYAAAATKKKADMDAVDAAYETARASDDIVQLGGRKIGVSTALKAIKDINTAGSDKLAASVEDIIKRHGGLGPKTVAEADKLLKALQTSRPTATDNNKYAIGQWKKVENAVRDRLYTSPEYKKAAGLHADRLAADNAVDYAKKILGNTSAQELQKMIREEGGEVFRDALARQLPGVLAEAVDGSIRTLTPKAVKKKLIQVLGREQGEAIGNTIGLLERTSKDMGKIAAGSDTTQNTNMVKKAAKYLTDGDGTIFSGLGAGAGLSVLAGNPLPLLAGGIGGVSMAARRRLLDSSNAKEIRDLMSMGADGRAVARKAKGGPRRAPNVPSYAAGGLLSTIMGGDPPLEIDVDLNTRKGR